MVVYFIKSACAVMWNVNEDTSKYLDYNLKIENVIRAWLQGLAFPLNCIDLTITDAIVFFPKAFFPNFISNGSTKETCNLN